VAGLKQGTPALTESREDRNYAGRGQASVPPAPRLYIGYHVSASPHERGALLGPGRFGELLAQGSKLATRELAMEVTRQAAFANRPSRLRCFFAFPSIEAARSWIAAEPESEQYLVEVEATDGTPLFVGDQRWLEGVDAVPTPDWLTRAAGYWSGLARNPSSGRGAWELVIGGPVRVRRCVRAVIRKG
jgi:hypothetical protein